jgi:predicted metal-dependent peptidase
MALTAKEKIIKCKIQLQTEKPFWSRLMMDLNIKEDTEGILKTSKTMAVDARGNLIYDKDFVLSLKEDELKFVLSHEVSHCMLDHLTRINKRDMVGWNLATDLVVNTILKLNGFNPPKIGLIPDYNHSFKMGNHTITKIDEKTAEIIYDELPTKKNNKGGGGGKDEGFDQHIFEEGMSEREKTEIQEKWKDRIIQANVYAEQKGNKPLGLERYIKELLNPKINWKAILHKYVTNALNSGTTWARPNKRFIGKRVYLPTIKKESLNVIVHIDTSGSIGQEILTEFVSEIVGIAKSFNNIKMTLIECDCEINQVLSVENGNIPKILSMKIKGGGGTSHEPLWEYIEENNPECNILISLTDGYSDVKTENEPRYDVIWAVPKNGVDNMPFGKFIKIED